MSELFKLFGRIPEFIYDLIARVLPGGLIAYALAKGKFISAPEGVENTIVFLVLAYVIGVASGTLANVLGNLVTWFGIRKIPGFDEEYQRIAKKIGEESQVPLNPFVAMKVLGSAHERIKMSNVDDVNELVTKLFAEVGLLYNMAFAVGIASMNATWPWWFAVAAIIFFFVSGAIRSWRTWVRHASILTELDRQKR